jgi:hypothetical protein
MKFFFRLFSVFTLLLLATAALGYFYWYLPRFKTVNTNQVATMKPAAAGKVAFSKLKRQLPALKSFISRSIFNTKHCFLLDMSIPSGKKRFFVYDLEKDSIAYSGLVTHGSGSDKDGEAFYFSNKPGSYCTSLGKYRIGNSYAGRFGLAFKLYGLDTSNSNAFDRAVVLHAHECVPIEEVAPFPICLSLGCPTVAPDFLLVLKKYINGTDKPILLSIYK